MAEKQQGLHYENGDLFLGQNRLIEKAREEREPFYVYDLDGIRRRVEAFKKSFTIPLKIQYAMKANANLAILKQMHDLALGVDIVSGGEMTRAMRAGFTAGQIVFSGVGKSEEEIEEALRAGIFQLNVESVPELERIAQIAARMGRVANVALRINPDVNAETHPYIRTGFRENKFGIDIQMWPEIRAVLKKHESLSLQGLTLHIGSQILDSRPIVEAISIANEFRLQIGKEGFSIQTFDFGGGWGINYQEGDLIQDEKSLNQYGQAVSQALKPFVEAGVSIICEPGRILVGRFGVLIGRVEYIKRTPHKTFAILNTGMHHLIRPALYQAYHRILPLRISTGPKEVYDVVGPICESSDVLGAGREMSPLVSGDFVAIADAGAYGYSMASLYNLHSMPKEFVIQGDHWREL